MRLVQLHFMAMSYMARAWYAWHAYLVLWWSSLQYFVAGHQALYNYASRFRCMFDVARAWRAWRAPVVLGVTIDTFSKQAHASGTITLHGYVLHGTCVACQARISDALVQQFAVFRSRHTSFV